MSSWIFHLNPYKMKPYLPQLLKVFIALNFLFYLTPIVLSGQTCSEVEVEYLSEESCGSENGVVRITNNNPFFEAAVDIYANKFGFSVPYRQLLVDNGSSVTLDDLPSDFYDFYIYSTEPTILQCVKSVDLNGDISFDYAVYQDCQGDYAIEISNVSGGSPPYAYQVLPYPSCTFSRPPNLKSLPISDFATSNNNSYTFYNIQRQSCGSTLQDFEIIVFSSYQNASNWDCFYYAIADADGVPPLTSMDPWM